MSARAGGTRRHARRRGFTLLELAVVTAVFAVLAVFMLQRIRTYYDQIELLVVRQTVEAIRRETLLRISQAIVRGTTAEIPRMLEANPMDWLAQKPANYLGEYYAPKATELSSGNWYFDKSSHTLVYLLNKSHTLANEPPKQLKFQLTMVNNRENSAGKIDSLKNTVTVIDLRQVDR
jgi:prepilin-type N-terminal cleavage/methylation domain-containing protein